MPLIDNRTYYTNHTYDLKYDKNDKSFEILFIENKLQENHFENSILFESSDATLYKIMIKGGENGLEEILKSLNANGC
jgi:hypothetical protein